MKGRRLLPCFVIALAPLGGASEPVRLDHAALGAIAVDPTDARAAREANDHLSGAWPFVAPDRHRPERALLERLRPERPAVPAVSRSKKPDEPLGE